jgi:hypothetical protein
VEIYWISGSPFAWRVLLTAEVNSPIGPQVICDELDWDKAIFFSSFAPTS